MLKSTLISGLAIAATSLMATTALSQDGKAISWWYETATPAHQDDLTNILVDRFNEANPEYDLGIDYRGTELDKQLRIALLSGSGPDIVYTPGPSYVAAMARAGQLMSLDDYADKLGWNDRILPIFLDFGRYDGTLYALPKTYETLGLYYNKGVFAENGWTPPTTIVELEALADEMLAKGMVPFGAGNSGWRPANEWLVSLVFNSIAGPDVIYKALTGEIPWTSEPIVKSIEALNKWWQAGYFGPDYFSLNGEQSFALVASGDAGMSLSGTWNFGNAAVYFPANDAEPGFVGFPSAEGVPYPVYALGIGSTFSIASTSKVADGAAAVIDFVFNEDFFGEMNTAWQGEWNMPLRDISNVEIGDEVMPLYGEALSNLAAAVDANQYGYTTWTFLPPATNSYLVSGIEEVWLGQIDIAEYLETFDKKFQKELAEGKVPAVPVR